MLLSVFRSFGSIRTVLRNFRSNSYLSSTRGVSKKKENVLFFKMPEIFKEKTTEQVESLRIVPEGYKLIYLSKDLRLVAMGRAYLFGLIAVCIWLGVGIYINPDLVVVRDDFFTKEQALFMVLMQAIVLYGFVTRHVYYIFRNDKSYKTVYYGLFGKYQPRIIDHEAKELISPNRNSLFPFLYTLKGKPVIVSAAGFNNKEEFVTLVKPYEEYE